MCAVDSKSLVANVNHTELSVGKQLRVATHYFEPIHYLVCLEDTLLKKSLRLAADIGLNPKTIRIMPPSTVTHLHSMNPLLGICYAIVPLKH